MTFKLAIVVGHNATQPGAYSQALGIAEFPYNSDIAERMKGKAPEFNIEARTFFREYRGDGYSAEIRRCYDHVNAWNPALCMELHFNGAGASANGTETLYYNGSTKGRTFANHVQQELLASFGLRNRGLKPLSPGDNGYGSVSAAKAPAILTEPFFGSNTGDCAAVQGREEVLALSYLRGARDAAAELGLVAERPPIEPPPPTEPPPTCPPTEEVLRLASVEQLAAELANRPEIESSLVLSRKLQSGGAINLRARGERPARSAAEPARMPPPPAPLPTDPPI